MNPSEYLNETRDLLSRLLWDEIDYVLQELHECRTRGGRLFLIGNGGGASYASHAASDFRKFGKLEAWAYDNMTELTARINDEGLTASIRDWLVASRINKNDLLFVFSVGGGSTFTSRNLVEAMKNSPARVVGICGNRPGYLAKHGDAVIVIPTDNTAQVESIQAVLFHLLAFSL